MGRTRKWKDNAERQRQYRRRQKQRRLEKTSSEAPPVDSGHGDEQDVPTAEGYVSPAFTDRILASDKLADFLEK